MNPRQESILKAIVDEYVRTAEPVGSAFLAREKSFDVSPATIRKEMAALDELGFILQPHTSAGRIPSETGFRYFVENFLEEKQSSREHIETMAAQIRDSKESREAVFKKLAKLLAELSQETVIVGFSAQDVYYTGISNLFQKPEFQDLARIVTLSSVVDRFDDIVAQLFERVDATQVLIGSENPFGEQCSTICTKVSFRDSATLFMILGPMRMMYERNIALIKQIIATLENV